MLKELNKLWLKARRRATAWKRWHRKLPHNRVRRARLRDEQGRPIGHGPPEPLPEPALPASFCRKVQLPSGRWEVFLSGGAVEIAYRLARRPRPTAEAVQPLPILEEEVRRLYEAHSCK
jgi:hypothetical protein